MLVASEMRLLTTVISTCQHNAEQCASMSTQAVAVKCAAFEGKELCGNPTGGVVDEALDGRARVDAVHEDRGLAVVVRDVEGRDAVGRRLEVDGGALEVNDPFLDRERVLDDGRARGARGDEYEQNHTHRLVESP